MWRLQVVCAANARVEDNILRGTDGAPYLVPGVPLSAKGRRLTLATDMDGELQNDRRPRYGIRQALVAIVASVAAIGAIAAFAPDDNDRSALAPAPTSAGTVAPGFTNVTDVTDVTEVTVGLSGPDTLGQAGSTATVPEAPSTTSATLAVDTTPAAPGTVATAPPVGLPAVAATAFAVYDATADTWLAESQADAPLPIGSVMKLLTSYVVLQSGDLAKVVTVPELRVDISESAIGLYKGEQLPRDVLLRAMLIVSANDAARALAIDVGGSLEGFVQQMNAAASSLGLSSTVAANPIGLDAAGAHSSARDMIRLAALLMQDQTFRAAVAKQSANLHGQTFTATNRLLTAYEGADGVKTGHTTDAGYCLIGSATRDGRTVMVAVFGAPTDDERLAAATGLLDWAFAQP